MWLFINHEMEVESFQLDYSILFSLRVYNWLSRILYFMKLLLLLAFSQVLFLWLCPFDQSPFQNQILSNTRSRREPFAITYTLILGSPVFYFKNLWWNFNQKQTFSANQNLLGSLFLSFLSIFSFSFLLITFFLIIFF